jgi:hypothetical protein
VIITTNHKTTGLYLPADDRRHFVAWSSYQVKDFSDAYWRDLWDYYRDGGNEHVTAYLDTLDLSGFNPKAPPPKTPVFWQIVNVNTAPEDADMMDALEAIDQKDAIAVGDLVEKADAEFAEWLLDRRNRRAIPHRLDRCGYVALRNRDAKDGLWKLNERRQVIYVRDELEPRQQLEAVQERLKRERSG